MIEFNSDFLSMISQLFIGQVTLIAISIGLLSLIIGNFKQKMYGIRLSNYLMFSKKCKLIFFQVSLSYMIKSLYILVVINMPILVILNCNISIFLKYIAFYLFGVILLSSICVLYIMIKDVLETFFGSNNLDIKVKEYSFNYLSDLFERVKNEKNPYTLDECEKCEEYKKLDDFITKFAIDIIYDINNKYSFNYKQNINFFYDVIEKNIIYTERSSHTCFYRIIRKVGEINRRIVSELIKIDDNESIDDFIYSYCKLFYDKTKEDKLSNNFVENVYYAFNFFDQIKKIIESVKYISVYDKEFFYFLRHLIISYAYYFMVEIGVRVNDNTLKNKDDSDNKVRELFDIYLKSVNKNLNFTYEQKKYAKGLLYKFNDKNSMFWVDTLNFDDYFGKMDKNKNYKIMRKEIIKSNVDYIRDKIDSLNIMLGKGSLILILKEKLKEFMLK